MTENMSYVHGQKLMFDKIFYVYYCLTVRYMVKAILYFCNLYGLKIYNQNFCDAYWLEIKSPPAWPKVFWKTHLNPLYLMDFITKTELTNKQGVYVHKIFVLSK